MFNNYAMTSNGYDAMNYYNSMYNPGKGYGNNYAHFGYYGPLVHTMDLKPVMEAVETIVLVVVVLGSQRRIEWRNQRYD